jgi:hypothetical protein
MSINPTLYLANKTNCILSKKVLFGFNTESKISFKIYLKFNSN